MLVVAIAVFANQSETESLESIGESAEVILERLITTHPDKRISQVIDSGELFILAFDSPLEVRGGFVLVDSETLRLTDGSKINRKGLVPLLVFNGNFLKGTYSDTFKKSAISHEFAHFLTWKEGGYPEHLLVVDKVIDTEKEMELFYREEVNGYTVQCEFLLKAGAVDQEKICSAFQQNDLVVFRKAIAREIDEAGGYEKFSSLLFRLAENYK